MQILGELEQKIMDVIWQENRPLKPAEVLDKLDGDFAYTTIMTIMKRLADKRVLKRKLKGKVYYYSAEPREKVAGKKLTDLFQNLVNSYGRLAISQFVDAVKNNPNDLETLRDYIENNEE